MVRPTTALRNPTIKREIRLIAISMVLFLAHQVMESFLVARFAPNGYSDLCQLDCSGYTSLSQFDYSNVANFAYFPLFPLASSFVAHMLDLAPQTGVIITSKVFFLFSIYAFIKLAQSIAPSTHAFVNGSIAAFNPYSIYGNSGYTESLFLFLTCIFFTLMERRSFLKAGLAGAFLSATRLVGLVSVVSYLISLIQPWPTWRWGDRIKVLAGMALIPTGLLIFMAYLQERTGDPLTFIHVQRAFGRATPVGPTSWIFNLSKGLSSDWWLYRYWAISGIVVLSMSLFFILRRKHVSLATFSLLSTIIPLASDCWGLSRYIWWQAPVLLFVALLFGRNRVLLAGWLTLAITINVWCYRLWFSNINWHIS